VDLTTRAYDCLATAALEVTKVASVGVESAIPQGPSLEDLGDHSW
jgi:hypothetical protein